MLAAWPGISNVAMIVATYLARNLEPKELAQICPNDFFDPVGIMVRSNIVEEPQFPKSIFYYHKNPRGEDLIIFLGDAQPNAKSYDLANLIIDVAERFHVQRIYTCAAAITRIHHTEQPRVWGVGTTADVFKDLAAHGAFLGGNLQIAGLNGLLLGVAKERNVDGACLLGEVPGYASRLHNPMAALAVVRILSEILKINVNLDELTAIAEESREHMKQMAAEAMEEYIDYFTEPIWESNDDDAEED